jgi:hypothetical protein
MAQTPEEIGRSALVQDHTDVPVTGYVIVNSRNGMVLKRVLTTPVGTFGIEIVP